MLNNITTIVDANTVLAVLNAKIAVVAVRVCDVAPVLSKRLDYWLFSKHRPDHEVRCCPPCYRGLTTTTGTWSAADWLQRGRMMMSSMGSMQLESSSHRFSERLLTVQ